MRSISGEFYFKKDVNKGKFFVVAGCSCTGCSLGHKGAKASCDAVVIKILRNAGAIPVCVTNTPEMCGGFESSNLLYGRSYNPYDTRYTPGGSSGGEVIQLGSFRGH